jgi:hypothetical protein
MENKVSMVQAKIIIRRFLIFIILVSLSLFGCTLTSPIDTINSATIFQSHMPSETPTPEKTIGRDIVIQDTPELGLGKSWVRITNYPTGKFYFSDNGESLIFSEEEGGWARYSFLTNEIEKIGNPEDYLASLNSISYNLKKYNVNRNCERLYFSPMSNHMICTERIYTLPTPTLDTSEYPTENLIEGTSIRLYFYDLYNKTEVFLGEIIGDINKVDWQPTNKSGVLIMELRSPFGIGEDNSYYFDVNQKSIQALKHLTPEYEGGQVISANTDWIIYLKNDQYYAYHIPKNQTIELEYSDAFFWGVGTNQLIGEQWEISNHMICSKVFILDMNNLMTEELIEEHCSPTDFHSTLQISPDNKKLAINLPEGLFLMNLR